jgi:hypothetical protein
MCNAAELVAGLITDISIPSSKRWIPVGMTVRYLAMAKKDLRAIGSCENMDWNVTGNLVIPVSIFCDAVKVLEADITMKISDRK